MSIENAKLFIDISTKLEKSPYWSWFHKAGKAPSDELLQADTFIKHKDLQEEYLESFCLKLRLLIQNRDGLSIYKMKEFALTFDNKYESYKTGIVEASDTLNKMLDSKASVQLETCIPTTYRYIFDVIFYGGMVHIDKEKRYEFQELQKAGVFTYFVFRNFEQAIMHYRNCYMQIAYNLFHYLIDIGEFENI